MFFFLPVLQIILIVLFMQINSAVLYEKIIAQTSVLIGAKQCFFQDSRKIILNPPQVVNELTDVPFLSDALVSKNKALKIFKSPLETHDTFERTLQRKHKFNFFEKFLCVISFGLASPLINHLNKSNDRKEAE